MIFASAENPLRGSKVPQLLSCSLKLYLLDSGAMTDTSSEAAHTGSMIHRAIEVWHRNGFRSAEAWRNCLEGIHEYRYADVKKSQRVFEGYSEDPRNRVETLLVEASIRVELPPWKTDKTRAPIVIEGHPDQVRREDGKLLVCDIKTGAKGGLAMMFGYTGQLVIYAMGCSKMLNEPVEPGYIMRVGSYATKQNANNRTPDDVFIRYPFTLAETTELIDEIRREVARVRRGEIGPRPSEFCTYCPAGHVGNCCSMLRQTLTLRSKK